MLPEGGARPRAQATCTASVRRQYIYATLERVDPIRQTTSATLEVGILYTFEEEGGPPPMREALAGIVDAHREEWASRPCPATFATRIAIDGEPLGRRLRPGNSLGDYHRGPSYHDVLADFCDINGNKFCEDHFVPVSST